DDGTRKLGAYRDCIKPDTKASTVYNEETVFERHRHRFAVNSAYETSFAEQGFIVSAYARAESEIKVMEVTDHPWFVACQYHPEFKSRPTNAHPLMKDFVGAIVKKKYQL